MHIAFQAAIFLETEPAMGFCDQDTLVAPGVDANNKPYVVVTVENDAFDDVAQRVPPSVHVLGEQVPVILMPMTMRHN